MKARVTIDAELCKGCGLCVTACPKQIVDRDRYSANSKGYHTAHVTEAEACIACGCCARMCPDSAITVEKWQEGSQDA